MSDKPMGGFVVQITGTALWTACCLDCPDPRDGGCLLLGDEYASEKAAKKALSNHLAADRRELQAEIDRQARERRGGPCPTCHCDDLRHRRNLPAPVDQLAVRRLRVVPS